MPGYRLADAAGGNMTALVTGATGCLGSHLVERLKRAGEDVRVLVRPQSRVDLLRSLGVEIATGDLRDEESLKRAVAGAGVVYHCAARVMEKGTWPEFDESNIRGTERLLSAAAAVGVKRFVHVSSIGVYGIPGNRGQTVTEEDGYDPYPWRRGFYTWSKIEADRLALRYGQRSGLSTVVVRPGILYGPRAKPFVARLHVAWGNKLYLIVGSPSYLLPMVHVQSVVDAMLLAGQGSGRSSEAYNIVDSQATQKEYLHWQWDGRRRPAVVYLPFSCALLLATILEITGRGRFRYRLLRVGQSLAYDTTKAEQGLGWRPAASLVKEPRRYASRAQ